jgi:hypothetical protein
VLAKKGSSSKLFKSRDGNYRAQEKYLLRENNILRMK